VVNASDEAHNFHIHQTHFRVLEVRGTGSQLTRPLNVLVDNYPVLVGQAIKVRVPLNRSEQIGTFVYHCHILQHEDKGMMGAIELRKVD
jgi:FtsP/CotA-like multicopper oxidase with cupredoxin domain